jgi:hypothetical protein
MTKCRAQTTERQERFILGYGFRAFSLWLAVSAVLAHGEAEQHGRRVWWGKACHLMAIRKRERERGRECGTCLQSSYLEGRGKMVMRTCLKTKTKTKTKRLEAYL